MSRYDNPCFDDCRKWIQKKRERGASWQELQLACKHCEEELSAFLSSRVVEDDWPALSAHEWKDLVSEIEEYEDKQKNLIFRGNDGALFDVNQDNGLKVPENERSCWQLYKKSLGWNPESVQDLEDATIGILRRLSSDTREVGPIKGLVIGHVQSGKTANMEALMAMAADHGWNMFIVLSGTIESLRLQTLKRMQKDLNQEGNLIWRGIEHPSKKSQYGERAQDFHFEPNAQSRYFTVCLKNASRLKKLIDWIHADKASHDPMKILIIDDETDQRVRVYNTSIIKQLKRLYGGCCQLCGKNAFDEFNVDISEAHHIAHFSDSQNNDSSNIIILCPNHHRLMHKLNPKFDSERGCFVFSDNSELRIEIDFHLMN